MARVTQLLAVAAAAAVAIAVTAPTRVAGGCTPRTDRGSVAVEAESGAPPRDGWAPVRSDGAAGIMWKPWQAHRGTDGPGRGVREYRFGVTQGGYYRLLLRASGAGRTDHNDFYVRLGRGARRVFPRGSAPASDGWLKTWQNFGRGKWAFGAIHNGGAPVTRWLRAGETFTFGLSGRSSRAAVDKFIFFRCFPADGSCRDGSRAYWAAVKASWGPPSCGGGGGGGWEGPPRKPWTPPAKSPMAPKEPRAPPPAPKKPEAPPPEPKKPEMPPPAPRKQHQPRTPPPPPPPSNNRGGRCGVHSARGGVVSMSAPATGGGGGWVVATRSGRRALIYKPSVNGHGIDAPGGAKVRNFRFKVSVAGVYRLVLRLNAPHPTEHNDVWAKLGPGATMKQGRAVKPLTGGWFKIYQNRGANQWMVGGVTKDFDGHDPLTRRLRVGETFTVGLSGRSSQLAVADVMLFVCDPRAGNQCGNGSAGFRRATTMGTSGCA